MPAAAPKSQRLFLALWPDAKLRQAIHQLVRQRVREGRRVRPENLHMTLVFLGATDPERLTCYEQVLEGIEVPHLEMTLDSLGWWRRPAILWLGSSRPLPALTELVMELGKRLENCGFTLESRPFRPHITLARAFPGPVADHPPLPPLHWSTDHLVLCRSLIREDGVHYQILRCWPSQG
ncbi:MAG: RNA 2',3'-cyclic phosphodiesterase [Candidatus Competibacteraceae bacterium]|nr:RNA 2',3'-cyclic phosphodiesterase [Candidatus Competibacteraceae bacterium]